MGQVIQEDRTYTQQRGRKTFGALAIASRHPRLFAAMYRAMLLVTGH